MLSDWIYSVPWVLCIKLNKKILDLGKPCNINNLSSELFGSGKRLVVGFWFAVWWR